MKKIIYILLLIFCYFNSAVADLLSCPSVNEIQNNNFNTWLPLYKEGEELASLADIEKFKAHVTHLELAVWDTAYLENAHCFYQGDDSIVNRITIAHDAYRPSQTINWRWIQPGRRAECSPMQPQDCRLVS